MFVRKRPGAAWLSAPISVTAISSASGRRKEGICIKRRTRRDTIYQIGALRPREGGGNQGSLREAAWRAPYNTIAHDARQAADVIEGIKAIDPSLVLMALAGAPIAAQARSRADYCRYRGLRQTAFARRQPRQPSAVQVPSSMTRKPSPSACCAWSTNSAWWRSTEPRSRPMPNRSASTATPAAAIASTLRQTLETRRGVELKSFADMSS